MSPQIKQRLIGGLILLAIIVFSIPFLLHHSQPTAQDPSGNVSDKADPQVELKLPPSQEPQTANSASSASNVSASQTSAPLQNSDQPLQMPPETIITPAPTSKTVNATNLEDQTHVLTPASSPSSSASAPKNVVSQNEMVTPTATPPTPAPTPAAAVQNQKVTPRVPIASEDTTDATKIAVSKPVIHKPVVVAKVHPSTAHGYFLQVGAFTNQGRANAVVHRLKSKGMHAFILKGKATHGHLNLARVYVGPEAKLPEIKRLRWLLKKNFNFKGIVLKRNLP